MLTVCQRPRVKRMQGGREPGAVGHALAPCSQASHRGVWISPGKGLGSLARVRLALVGSEGRLGHGEWLVGPADMDEEADEDESNHEEWVK